MLNTNSTPRNARHSSPPSSPMQRRKHSSPPRLPPGFRPSPRTKHPPIAEMTVRELQDLRAMNARILATPGASSSSYVQRISAEQATVESRLIELVGVEAINEGLKHARIVGENDMNIDGLHEPPLSRAIAAKQKALAKFGSPHQEPAPGILTLKEAIDLEQQAHFREKERQERIDEKKRRLGLPIKGEALSRQEREARIWAFMNYKPTDSDLEDDSEDDEEDEDPANWFEDDQDDGRKGQNIIEPDVEDLSDIIRVDNSRISYNNFYEPHDDGD